MTYWTSNWWIESEKWPRDPHGWIFLGRAVHKLGKGMFEEAWRGLEPMAWLYAGADALKPFPILSKNATPGQMRFADHILTHLRPDLADGPRPPSTQGSFTPDEWKRVKAFADEHRLVRRNGATRFSQLVHLLAKEVEAGRLVTGFRPEAGGAVRPMAPEWWNTEKLRPRFTMCQMKPTDPFGNGFSGKDYCWIFVEAAGLDALITPEAIDKEVAAGSTALGTDSNDQRQLATPASQPRSNRGSPVQYPKDELIIADVLGVLALEPDRPVAPLIKDAADARGCSPTTADEVDRLVDRVTRKVKRRRQRLAEQLPG